MAAKFVQNNAVVASNPQRVYQVTRIGKRIRRL